MFCKECGAEIPDDVKFCSECGTKLVDDKSTVQSEPVKSEPVESKSIKSEPVKSETVEKESFFKKNKKVLIGCCVGLIVIFVLVALLSSGGNHDTDNRISNEMDDVADNMSESDFKSNCTAIEYAQLTKNSDKFYGNRTVVSGTVLQIMEDKDGGIIRLATNGGYDDIVAVMYSGNNDVVDGDQITVYGYVMKDYSYESQANMHITIPCISGKYIEKG